jgi:hypothetical protein
MHQFTLSWGQLLAVSNAPSGIKARELVQRQKKYRELPPSRGRNFCFSFFHRSNQTPRRFFNSGAGLWDMKKYNGVF